MDISVSNEKSPRQTQSLEQAKKGQVKLARAQEASLERFKQTMPDGKVNNETFETLRRLEKISLSFNKKLQFIVDQQTDQVMVKVIDANTDKVIKVLPPKELQRLSSRIKEDIGFLFDEVI